MKGPNPSYQLQAAAKAVIMAKAVVETLRPKIKKIQQDLLDAYGIRCSSEWTDKRAGVEGMLTPENKWLMSDEDAAIYYPELDKEYRKAGFTEIGPGQCPLLVAEDLLRKAERLFMEASIELTAKAGMTEDLIEKIITCQMKDGLKNRQQYLDLSLSYVVPFLPEAGV